MTKVSKAKVLLLDDDIELLELIQDYFKPRGYEFIAHASAEQGVNEIIRQSSGPEPIDLVITDFRLPNMNGIELIEQLKRVAPQIPIILITAHSSLDLAIEAIEKGAYDFVVKPIQFPQLSISMARAVYFSRLQTENQKLKSTIESSSLISGKIIAKSGVMRSIVDLAKRVAKSDATVLISGESGTGKEVLAQLIHSSSRRASEPFVAINCSAIPEALLESELFGHAKGSFTGADQNKVGIFEEANEGTLFLDEIGDLSQPLQAKLLRVIQERKIKRVGENQYRDINVRLLAASHKNLAEEVQAKRFREDLFFRLNVIPIKVPPLRERKEDVLPLAEHFLKVFKERNDVSIQGFSKKALQFMLRHDWRGNVRELENSIERAVVLCEGQWIEEHHFLLPDSPGAGTITGYPTYPFPSHELDERGQDLGPAPTDPNTPVPTPLTEEEKITQLLESHQTATAEEARGLDQGSPSSHHMKSLEVDDATTPGTADDSSTTDLPNLNSSAPHSLPPSYPAGAQAAGAGALSSVHLLAAGEFVPLATLELRYIKYVVNQVHGVKDRAAKILQVDRKTLYRKLEAIENRRDLQAEPKVDAQSTH